METAWLSGPAKNLIRFARHAAEANTSSLRVSVSVATFRRGKTPVENDFTVACKEAQIGVHQIQERFAFDPAIVPAIRKLIAEYNPDILQTHSVKSHFLIRLSGAYRRYPWIAFHHGYTWTDLKVLLYNQLDRWSLPASSRVVTVCNPFASELERLGVDRGRIAIRHNAVNPFVPASDEAVSEVRRVLRIPPGTRVLLSVGRLSREKGQAELIKALANLRNQNAERKLRLLVVGDGPDLRRLERLASASGVADCVSFVGHQFDVAPYYTLADVMVLPSSTEGSPNALLEAMAAGLPIVATAVGGVPEIVSDRNSALLVPKEDPAALSSAIARVLDSDVLRQQLSQAARNTASAYTPQAYCDFMFSLYRDCLAPATRERADCSQHSESSATRIQKKMVLTD
ncbi:MAG: glycosyltransferase [Candidatus Acidiferrales bacterium]